MPFATLGYRYQNVRGPLAPCMEETVLGLQAKEGLELPNASCTKTPRNFKFKDVRASAGAATTRVRVRNGVIRVVIAHVAVLAINVHQH